MPNETNILSINLQELDFSKPFKDAMVENEFNTLHELLKLEVSDMLKLPGFNYHMLKELISFLEKNNLLALLKQTL